MSLNEDYPHNFEANSIIKSLKPNLKESELGPKLHLRGFKVEKIKGDIPNTILAIIAIGLVIWGYFKNGTVYIAFKQLKKENFEKEITSAKR